MSREAKQDNLEEGKCSDKAPQPVEYPPNRDQKSELLMKCY